MHPHKISIPVTKLDIDVNKGELSLTRELSLLPCCSFSADGGSCLKDQAHSVYESKNLGVFYKTNS